SPPIEYMQNAAGVRIHIKARIARGEPEILLRRRVKLVRKLAIVLVSALLFFGVASAQTFYTIGTGGVTGVYYPVGGAISKLVNDQNVGLRLTVESTAASVFN